MTSDDLCYLDLVDVGRRIQARQLSSLEVTRATLDRIARLDTRFKSYATLTPELALAQAHQADSEIVLGTVRGPLHGVPVAVKDLCHTKGIATAAGMAIHKQHRPDRDATVVTRLAEAGAVLLGKLKLTEGAFAAHHPSIDAPVNPWSAAHWTGVSSSGSGVATAVGLCYGSLGSDTGGSIRFPSTMNGVTGLKPTWGRVSRAGAMPLAPALDTVGVIARHVEDLALTLGVLAGPDPRDPAASSVPVPDYVARLTDPVVGVRVGVDETVIAEAHPEVQGMVGEVTDILVKLGLRRARCRFYDWQTLDHLVQLVQLPDASSAHSVFLRTRPTDYGPQVRTRAEVGHFISAVDHLTALRARGLILKRTLQETFKDADIAVLPILADPLPTIAELDVSGGSQVQAAMGRVVRFTRPINYLGLPTLTLPIPRSGGLPNGVQLIGRPYAEALLLAIGQAYQREVPPEIVRPLTM